jgi:hypothetical protein
MRALRKDATGISDGTNPQYKGIAPRITKEPTVNGKRPLDEILSKWAEEEDSDGDADFEDDISSGESSDSYDGDDRQRFASSDDDDQEENARLIGEAAKLLDAIEDTNTDDECCVPEVNAEFEEVSLSTVDERT